ncbi:MAG: hypothetical protein J0M08_08060 [Bacteroidetes bacterium]|nr:hypothetical protein [Bacteroidota bacterium]
MRRIYLVVLILILAILTTTAAIMYKTSDKSDGKPAATYKKDWEKVDSLTNEGLAKSALQVVDDIYKKSISDKNSIQSIKAILHQLKLTSYVDENFFSTTVDKLNKEIEKSSAPTKNILHSITADIYWQYYQNNRWKFLDRTTRATVTESDIETWDLAKISEVVNFHYAQSLANKDLLCNTSIADFEEILISYDSTSKALRPTLFDFVANKALSYYSTTESELTKPVYSFELNDVRHFDSAPVFAKQLIQHKDSASNKLMALKLFQQLINLHLTDKQPDALYDIDLARIQFVYNHSVLENKNQAYLNTLTSLKTKCTNHPFYAEVCYELAKYYIGTSADYKPKESAEHKWDKKIALALCEEGIKKYPNTLGANNCTVLKNQINFKNLSIQADQVLPKEETGKLLVSYTNISKLYFRIMQVRNDFSEMQHTENYGNEQYVNKLLNLTPLHTWSVDLPVDSDYYSHTAEIKTPKLSSGRYAILCSNSSSFEMRNNGVAFLEQTISNIGYAKKNIDDGGSEIFVFDRTSGLPIAKTAITLWETEYNYSARQYKRKKGVTYVTNKDGSCVITEKGSYRNYDLQLVHKGDTLWAMNDLYLYKRNNEVRKQTRTFLFTDRSIYRPGQTIYFKGLVLEQTNDEHAIKTNHSSVVTFYDANYQKVSSLNLKTNEYGTFSGSFVAPMGSATGMMQISNENGNTSFSVEEYKRPKFEVVFNKANGSYKLNDNVEIIGKAKAYSGASIDGASVKYRIVRNARFPYWCYWWRGYAPTSAEMEIANGVVATNDTGAFVINFNAIADKSVSKEFDPTFNFTIYADVTDINGETRSSETVVSVGYKALLLEIDCSEYVSKEKLTNLEIKTTNLSGEPEPAVGEITIYKLASPSKIYRKRNWSEPEKQLLSKTEFDKLFPSDEYANEREFSSWAKETKIAAIDFNTAKEKTINLESFSKQWKQGVYVIEGSSKDKYGADVKSINYFTLFGNEEKSLPYLTADWFVAEKIKGEPGEKAVVSIGSSYPNTRIIYEIESNGKIEKRETLVLSNEKKTIEIPIEEKHRGNFAIHFFYAKENRTYIHNQIITVPYTNKELDIIFETFRNKLLPGSAEEWTLKVKGKKGEKVVAEMLAGMYDASLDAFKPHNWYFSIYQNYYSRITWNASSTFASSQSVLLASNWNTYQSQLFKNYHQLNWFGLGFGGDYYNFRGARGGLPAMMSMEAEGAEMDEMAPSGGDGKSVKKRSAAMAMTAAPAMMGKAEATNSKDEAVVGNALEQGKKVTPDFSDVKVRSNFNETAFFFPQLQTNENGEISIKFTIPDALTKWKFMSFTHTKDLKFGLAQNEVVTQKPLMVVPNAPRFFRQGDKLFFSSKITNLSDKEQSGQVQLFLIDPFSGKAIDADFKNTNALKSFTVKGGLSISTDWEVIIPDNAEAVTYKVVAKTADYSDGEEMTIPVLTNRMLVTEALPLPIRGKQTKTYTFDKFISQNNKSTTLRNHALTLEFTSNPAWYAIQALPYLMEYPYECAEQTFSRYYANAIAHHIANSKPKIKAVFESWKTQSPDALLSNLEKNKELKALLLEETPWVLQAKNESERKRRVALLFDLNKMSSELEYAIKKLQKMQTSNGGWPWFEGMPDDAYITQHIVCGLGHLDHLKIKSVRENAAVWNMLTKAVQYVDARMQDRYNDLQKYKMLDKYTIDQMAIHYLYTRSYFKDIAVDNSHKTAFDFYLAQASKNWLKNGRYLQGMAALALSRYSDSSTPKKILASLKENAIVSEEMGMYWKESYTGYWYESPIESHAMLIEAFDEIANDTKVVNDLKTWLLKNKQTNDWKTTKATTEACYALLLRGEDWLDTEINSEITLGTTKIDPYKMDGTKVEAGTGYFKTTWRSSDIKPEMGNITIAKTKEGISWGAMYWQYFEQLDKIPSATNNPLKVAKKLFVETVSDKGPVLTAITDITKLKPGDKVKVRIELRVDRNMEYVHLKDMRASCFEPTNVLSSYKWQGGLGYYESTRDAATNFFISYLPKGTYVFEYPLIVSHYGNFSNGITTIQCMYAPEFTTHSEGIRVSVEK